MFEENEGSQMVLTKGLKRQDAARTGLSESLGNSCHTLPKTQSIEHVLKLSLFCLILSFGRHFLS